MAGYSDTSWWKGGAYDANQDWLKYFNSQNGYNSNNRDLNASNSQYFRNLLTDGGGLDPSFWMGQAKGTAGSMSSLLENLSNMSKSSTQDRTKAFLSTMPGLQDYAQGVTDRSMKSAGTSFEDLAKAQSAQSVRQMANKLGSGGMFGASSGAALSSLGGAAQMPLLESLNQMAQMRSGIYNNALNPLAQMAYNRELGRTNEAAGALGAANGLMSSYGNIGQGLAGLLGQQSEQMFLGPEMRVRTGMGEQLGTAALGGLMNGLGASAGGPQGWLAGLGSAANDILKLIFQGQQAPVNSYYGSQRSVFNPMVGKGNSANWWNNF